MMEIHRKFTNGANKGDQGKVHIFLAVFATKEWDLTKSNPDNVIRANTSKSEKLTMSFVQQHQSPLHPSYNIKV